MLEAGDAMGGMQRRGRARVATLVVLALAAFTPALVSADPAAATTPTVSVAPSTALSDAQLVNVRGSGFVPGDTVGVVECQASILAMTQPVSYAVAIHLCGGGFPSLQADAAGNVATSLRVSAAFPAVDGNMIGCGNPGDCAVALSADASFVLEGQSLTFSPTATGAPAIVLQPADQTALFGGTVLFRAVASGIPSPSEQWQVSSDGGATFTDISGATLPVLVIRGVSSGQNSYRYRAVFTNTAGTTTSNVATLIVGYPPLNVTPSSGLIDGQFVTITASGLPNTLFRSECSSSVLGLEPQSLSTLIANCRAPDGVAGINYGMTAEQMQVHNGFTALSNAPVVCSAPGSCAVVLIAAGTGGYFVIGQPITFGSPDTDLALSGVPSDVTVDATSPAGAMVSYPLPTAVDEETPPAVTCSPVSSSTFAVGVTTVNCSATDGDDTPATVSASFQVTVLSAAQQLANLANSVNGLGSGGSLSAKVASIQTAPNLTSECNKLGAFVNEVNAEVKSGKITQTQGDALLASAGDLGGTLGC